MLRDILIYELKFHINLTKLNTLKLYLQHVVNQHNRMEQIISLIHQLGYTKNSLKSPNIAYTFHLYVHVRSLNIPAASPYGVYISLSWYDIPELVVPIRISSVDRGLLLTRKLLNQGFLLVMSKSSLRKFYGRHHDLVDRYGISVSQMTTDMLHLSQTLPGLFLIHDLSPGLLLVAQERPILPEHPSSPPVLVGFVLLDL